MSVGSDLNSAMLQAGTHNLLHSTRLNAGCSPRRAQLGLQRCNGTGGAGVTHLWGPVILAGALGLLGGVCPWA